MSFLQRLNTKWQEMQYEDICQLHVTLTKRLGGSCSPLYVDPGGVVKSSPEDKLGWLRFAAIAHSVTCAFKLLSIVHYVKCQHPLSHHDISDSNDKDAMNGVVIGRTVIYMYFAMSCFVGSGHLLLKQKQLARFFNFLAIFDQLNIGLGQFNGNPLMKMIAFQAPSVTIGCSGIIALQQYLQFEKPGSISYPLTKLYGLGNSSVVDVALKSISVGVTIYECWNLIWGLAMCLMPGFCGLFVGFGAIYIGARTILMNIRQPGYSLKESFRLYRRLQILTSLINECFQDDFALWIMTFLMAWVVVTSAFISDSQVRSGLASQEFYMSICLLCEIYTFFLVGYTFPGQAHVFSKRIRLKWRKKLLVVRATSASSTKDKAESKRTVNITGLSTWPALDRRVIRSYQDIKLRFGSVNFYGRMTALVVVQFEVEKSLKLMLLMKKN